MEKKLYKSLTILIAIVWLINGLGCKVMNLVPRHQQIVEQILGAEYARELTVMIGVSEIIMAIWILSGFKSKLNAFTQILIVATMNVLEFVLVPELLMWGKLNSMFALLFISVVGYNEFVLNNDKLFRS